MEKHHFEQAKIWMEAARYTAELSSYDSSKYAVAVAMLIHAILKANDALTFKFYTKTAKRHDDARRLFLDLIHDNLVRQDYASFADIIQDAVSNKAKAEYRLAYFSKNDYEGMKRKAEKFIKMASEIIV